MQTIARKKRTDKNFVVSALDALQSGNLEAEAMLHLDEDMGFIPSNNARHRVPNIFPLSNPVQKCKSTNNKTSQVKKKKKMWTTFQVIVEKKNIMGMETICTG